MMKIRPYQYNDERAMESALEPIANVGEKLTICVNNKPVAIVGMTYLWGHGSAGLVWASISDEARRFPKSLCMLCIEAMHTVANEMGMASLVAFVNDNHYRNGNWLVKMLGFVKKCELKHSSPDGNNDCHVYWRSI